MPELMGQWLLADPRKMAMGLILNYTAVIVMGLLICALILLVNLQTLGFETPELMDQWLLANPRKTAMGLILNYTASGALGFGIQIDASNPRQMNDRYEDPTFKFILPLQAAAEREITRATAGSECTAAQVVPLTLVLFLREATRATAGSKCIAAQTVLPGIHQCCF